MSKNKKNKNKTIEIVLIISALILGMLIVFLVYKNKKEITGSDVERELEAGYPSPTEIIDSDRQVYFLYTEIPESIYRRMSNVSINDKSPVTRDDLRYLSILYWGTDDKPHKGELIVNKEIADDLSNVFFELYKASYTIGEVKLIDEYGGNDEVSMANNNTSCFNSRGQTGDDSSWSRHAYGMAIDINPYYNPYVNGDEVLPVTASEYVDRTKNFKMKIDESDYAYQVFTKYGFTWGESWGEIKDYQHFEK